MSKKPVNQKKAQQQEQENITLNNIFNTFLGGLVAECYLFILYRGYIAGSIDSLLAWHNVLQVLVWVGAAVLVGGGVLALVKKADGKLRKRGIFAAVLGAFFAISSWVAVTFFDTGVIAMCTIVPVLTVLALIYFLYQRECFVDTVMLSAALFVVWICGRGLDGLWSTVITVGAIGVIVLLAVSAVLVYRISRNEGKLGRWQLFAADVDWRVTYLAIAVSAALVLLGLFLPGMGYYLIWAAVLALFAEIAYYTSKMM